MSTLKIPASGCISRQGNLRAPGNCYAYDSQMPFTVSLWTSTSQGGLSAYNVVVNGYGRISMTNSKLTTEGYPIRCFKDSNAVPVNGACGTAASVQTTKPSTNLCSAGSASTVGGS